MQPNKTLELTALDGFPLVKPGDPLLPLIETALTTNAYPLKDNDIIVLAQKIVSKAENRYLSLDSLKPSTQALELAQQCEKDPRLVQAILNESTAVVRCTPGVLIVRHRLGFVLANAGIDHSNIPGGDTGERVLLLPVDPDQSAETLQADIRQRFGIHVGVLINDSFGRPWRLGTSGVCIGCAGILPLRDHRGEKDIYQQSLKVTQVARGDELAAAASLLMGQAAERRPVVIVRGISLSAETAPATTLVRASNEDLFR